MVFIPDQGVGQSERMRRLLKALSRKMLCLRVDELILIENGSIDWYCTNCKADWGLCSSAVLNGHKAVQCDGCEL